MNQLKKILIGLAVAVALALVGTNSAWADACQVTSGNTGPTQLNGVPTGVPTIRAESRTDLISAITITCPQATSAIGGAAATSAVVTVILSGANFAGTASGVTTAAAPLAGPVGAPAPAFGQLGGATTTTCGSATSTPDNLSKFPCPALILDTAVTTANSVAVGASVAGNTAVFTFSPSTPAGGATGVYVIFGLRADAGGAGLANNSILTATVNIGGTLTVGNSAPVQVATAKTAIKTTSNASGFSTVGGPINASTLNIASCAPVIPTPAGSPSTVKVGPDPSVGGINSLQVTIQEGFTGAFRASQANGGTEDIFAQPAAVSTAAVAVGPETSDGTMTGSVNGTRLLIILNGVPTGMAVYAPRTLPAKSDGRSGTINGSNTNLGLATPVITRVIGNDVDGSGGAAGGVIQDQFDLVSADSKGNVTIVYEVTAESILTTNLYAINLALSGTAPVGTGTISGALGFGPTGTPTINPSRPQGIGVGKPATVATVNACASYLLFPWVAETNDGNYSTGMAIANTSSDPPGAAPAGIGTASQTGDVNLFFFPSDGSASFTQKIGTGVKGGQTVTFVTLSLKKAFTGYVIAVCGFSFGHGFAFIDNPIGGQNGFAQGYLALSLQNPRFLVVNGVTGVETTGQ